MKRRPNEELVREALSDRGILWGDVHLSVSSDINVLGEYDLQWLIVTQECLFVFDPKHGSEPLHSFKLSEIDEFRLVPAVGSGLLQARCEGIWIDVLRFSNRIKFDFDQALKILGLIKKGDIPTADKIDEADPQRCGKCGLMLEFPGEVCVRCVSHRRALFRMLDLLKPYSGPAAIILGLLGIGIALDMVWPLLTRFLVDFVLVKGNVKREPPFPWLAQFDSKSLLIMVVATLAGVHVIRAAVNLATGRISSNVGNAITFDIRARLVKKLQELSLAFYSKQETGSLVGRVAYDTDAVQNFIMQVTSGFVMQFLLVVLSFVMMFKMEASLALWATLPAPFVFAGAVGYWRYVHPRFRRFWHRSSKQAGYLNGLLSGIRVVKAFAQEETEFQKFQKTSAEVRDSRLRLDKTSAYFYPIMAIVFQIGGWVIWYVGGLNVLSDKMSLGTLMAFFGYLSMFYGPLGSLTNLTTWLTSFTTQVHRIDEILETPTVLPEPAQPVRVSRLEGRVEFKDVTFGYVRGNPVLEHLNFSINSREKVGIVGRSGSGKTSIVNLLSRFYDVEGGSILVDGIDVRNISTKDLRSQISVVLQEPFLFQGTLLENIKYGRADATLEQILDVSRGANAHELIMQRPLAYDSSVGERGSELSGGERQRISIARALLCTSPILVLDEATSSIDSESELAIQTALDEVSKRRTTIIIAHRLSTVMNCDRIYVVETGKIVEQGTHRELLRQDGRYARWVKIQQGQGYGEKEEKGEAKPKITLPPAKTQWLNPGDLILTNGPRHSLQVKTADGKEHNGVFALRCFPIHFPDRYISLRYVDGNQVKEIGLISELNAWPEETRDLILRSLKQRYFFHTIERVKRVEAFARFLLMEAATDVGDVEFVIRYSPDSAQDFGLRGKLLVDVEDNFYIVPDLNKMPRSDRALLGRYIYW